MSTLPITIKDLQFSYPHQEVLKALSIDIEENRFYSIIGPNGTGKSTLLKLICNILSAHKESIYLQGEDLAKISMKQIARSMALVPQNTNVDFDFTVEEVVAMGRTPYMKRFQNTTKKDIDLVEDALHLTDTYHLKDKKINAISGGERQRVIIAKAIAQQTNILLLDEPVSHLDIHHQIAILNVLKDLQKRRKLTVITVLHDLNLAASYSDELILLNNGNIQVCGAPEKVITEEHIKDVYNMEVTLINNPNNNKPYIIPKI